MPLELTVDPQSQEDGRDTKQAPDGRVDRGAIVWQRRVKVPSIVLSVRHGFVLSENWRARTIHKAQAGRQFELRTGRRDATGKRGLGQGRFCKNTLREGGKGRSRCLVQWID